MSQRRHAYSSLLRRYAMSTDKVTAGDKALRTFEMSVNDEWARYNKGKVHPSTGSEALYRLYGP